MEGWKGKGMIGIDKKFYFKEVLMYHMNLRQDLSKSKGNKKMYI